jgi:oligopeptide/dipeptide ABC transporter ATP-binding protein
MGEVGTESGTGTAAPLLSVRDLRVALAGGRTGTIIDGLSFDLAPGEVLGIVGESGCGKTMTARAIIGLNRFDGRFRIGGEMLYKGRDLLRLDERGMRAVRGREIAMIFQDPMTSLNPLQRIGRQIGEMLALHTDLSAAAIRARAIELLRRCASRIPSARRRLSAPALGRHAPARDDRDGARLRAAPADRRRADDGARRHHPGADPRPDRDAAGGSGMAVILITHDLGVVAEIADRVLVMYAGQCVEAGSARDLFRDPQHPYTAGLLAAIPAGNRARVARLPAIKGAPPPLSAARPPGCTFRPRCARAYEPCGALPDLAARTGEAGHLDRCWLPPRESALSPPRCARRGRPRSDCGRRARAAGRGPRAGQALPGARARARRPRPHSACGRRRLFRDPPRRDAGPGWRIRLRQVHVGRAASCGCSSRPPDRSPSPARTSPISAWRRSGRCAGACRWSSRTRWPASTR